jgi:hypothetical protein
MDSYIQITQRAMMFCIWIAGRQLRCQMAADCTAFAKGLRYADDNTDHSHDRRPLRQDFAPGAGMTEPKAVSCTHARFALP